MEETGSNKNDTVSRGSSPQQAPKVNVDTTITVKTEMLPLPLSLPPSPTPSSPPSAPPQPPVTTPTPTPTPTGTSGRGTSYDWSTQKKRGRPRKYDADGNLSPEYLRSIEYPSPKRSRRSASASPRQVRYGDLPLPLNSPDGVFASSAAGDFITYVLRANTGEDIAEKILSFAQSTRRGISILTATGPISNATLRQPGSAGGMLSYEGRFEILSLSGSFPHPDGLRSRIGGLSVSLANHDGGVIGGVVCGPLKAAAPIQIVLGSFTLNFRKRKTTSKQPELTVKKSAGPETAERERPVSEANADDGNSVMDMPCLPANQIQRESGSGSSEQENLDATPAAATGNGSEEHSDQRTNPDVNKPFPEE